MGDGTGEEEEEEEEDVGGERFHWIDEPTATVTTVQAELRRKQLARGSGWDPSRREMEFLGSRTLLGVLLAIVHSNNDLLFDYWTKKADRGLPTDKLCPSSMPTGGVVADPPSLCRPVCMFW